MKLSSSVFAEIVEVCS